MAVNCAPVNSRFITFWFFISLLTCTLHILYNMIFSSSKKNNELSDICKGADLRDKVVVVTGSNTGIGKESARFLSYCGATVILACRDKDKAMAACHDINNDRQQVELSLWPHARSGNADFEVIDFSDLKTISPFVTALKKKLNGKSLFALILNAGINLGGTGVDGLEFMLQVNYLSQMALLMILRSLNIVSDMTNLVCLSSWTHHCAPHNVLPKDSAFNDGVFDGPNYRLSKYYMQLLPISAMSKLGMKRALAVSPGTVSSDIWRTMPVLKMVLTYVPVLLTTEQGCATSVAAALRLPSFNEELQQKKSDYITPYKLSSDVATWGWFPFDLAGPYYGIWFSQARLPPNQADAVWQSACDVLRATTAMKDNKMFGDALAMYY